MLRRWWRRHREERVLRDRAIPQLLWDETIAQYPFLACRPAEDLDELKRLATLFLSKKEFTGAGGLVVTDAMAVAIAAQACLPVLRLGLHWYDGFLGLVIHPDEVVARRQIVDEAGVVHDYDEVLAGEAMEGGPLMLSWHDVASAGESAALGYNVVIHEFVHVMDMIDGAPDGMPPLPNRKAQEHWLLVMQAAFDRFVRMLDSGREPFLDPYGAEGLDEFFPVTAEAFFTAPLQLQDEHPALYDLLAGFFEQDPARHF
ncbi:MAG TPA: M90 family metallopeptidase [Burkholderiaceae bacterium]|jgi:Mlc titration factor MtfA (ptsG expression regulator)|nr:M90 family metallopeptidase [Burkholderiaceae bacterium]